MSIWFDGADRSTGIGGADSGRGGEAGRSGGEDCTTSGLGFLCIIGDELRALFSSCASSSLSLVAWPGTAPSNRSVAHCLTLQPSPSHKPRFSLSKNPISSSRAS